MKRWIFAAVAAALLTGRVCAAEARWEPETDAVWESLAVEDGQLLYLPVAAGYRWIPGEHSAAFGCELLAREGAPVVAMEDGTVERAETDRGGRLLLSIRSADGRRCYRYTGLVPADGAFPPRGSRISGGSVIGITPESKAPLGRVQLYLQVQKAGEMPAGVDPYALLCLLRGNASSVVFIGDGRGFVPVGRTGG